MSFPNIFGKRTEFRVVEWLTRSLTDNPQIWHFFGVCKDLGGELNSSVVEWLNKGLMSVSSEPSANNWAELF